MLSTILNAFQVADIRKKLAFTAGMLLIYRVGSHIPVPGVNLDAVNNIQKQFGGSNILGLLNLFSGGGLGRIAIFALGIMPYITVLDHPAAAAGGGAVAGEALQGRRGRAGAHHAVHPLPDGRAWRSRSRSATSSCSTRCRPKPANRSSPTSTRPTSS